MHVIALEMLLAVVELQQLPLLLLLLKLHITCIKVVRGLLLLLFAIVCRMTQFVVVAFLQLIPVFIQTRFIPMHPLAVLSHKQPRFKRNHILIIHVTHPRNYRHAGRQSGRQPAAAKPSWYHTNI